VGSIPTPCKLLKVDKENNSNQETTPSPNKGREQTELLFQHGGLKELDFDYYQGECPEINH
jgi:hypothetical protein